MSFAEYSYPNLLDRTSDDSIVAEVLIGEVASSVSKLLTAEDDPNEEQAAAAPDGGNALASG